VADLLVTGTDTGVGKTVVAAALVMCLRKAGLNALGFKPVETGVDGTGEEDSLVLAQASGVQEPLARPLLSLPDRLAPAVAAERAGLALDPVALEERLFGLRAKGYTIVVEGAGGILVPWTWQYTALDLAVRTGLKAVVVSRAGLGTLNHVMLTVEALRSHKIPLRGVVLNSGGDASDLAEQTNLHSLARLLPGVRLVKISRHSGTNTLQAAEHSTPLLGEL